MNAQFPNLLRMSQILVEDVSIGTRAPGRPSGGATRWPGIKGLSEQLGRNINYVRNVLDGKLSSPRLMERIKSSGHVIAKLLETETN